MEVKSFSLDFRGQPIIVEEILFGQTRYIYIGSARREFDDLSLSYPNIQASTHLLGEKPSDDLGIFLSSIFGGPVLFSYSFPLENDDDQERVDFVKLSLSKHYSKKEKQ